MKKRHMWRRPLAWVLLIIGLVMLPLAVTGAWARGNIFDTEGFVDTVGPLASDPAIQDQMATSLTDQIFSRVDLRTHLQSVLPGILDVMAGPIEERVKTWTFDQARGLVGTPQAATIWTAAARRLHATVVAFFDGTGNVYLSADGMMTLDLSPLSTRVVDLLALAGVQISAEERPILSTGQVPVADASGFNDVRGLLSLLNKLFVVLPILAVLFIAASVAIAAGRRRAAVRAGLGIMAATAVLVILVAIGRRQFLEATQAANISVAASDSLWGALTISLRATAWGLFVLGVILVVHPYVVRGWITDRPGRFLSRHKITLAAAVLAIGFLALVLFPGPPLWAIVLVAALVIAVEGAILFFARSREPGAAT